MRGHAPCTGLQAACRTDGAKAGEDVAGMSGVRGVLPSSASGRTVGTELWWALEAQRLADCLGQH